MGTHPRPGTRKYRTIKRRDGTPHRNFYAAPSVLSYRRRDAKLRRVIRLTRLIAFLHRLKNTSPICVLSTALLLGSAAAGDTAAFDLIGPKVEIRVQRAGVTLPIAEVPNLQAGDRLWSMPIFPIASQCGT